MHIPTSLGSLVSHADLANSGSLHIPASRRSTSILTNTGSASPPTGSRSLAKGKSSGSKWGKALRRNSLTT